MTDARATAATVCDLVKRINPVLAEHDAKIQAGVLADLLATYLARYQGADASGVREVMIQEHIAAARRLIPVNEAILRDEGSA
jgi:hypothetical protein